MDDDAQQVITKAVGAPSTPAELPPLGVNDTIGRYRVEGKLGSGGMGVVYRVRDPELDRELALKLIRRDRGGRESLGTAQSRLKREARVMARLTHPNVVPVFDVGRFREVVFVAMELVDGVTLKRWLVAESRSLAEILVKFTQAGRGLAAAHGAGIIHRDFKPGNAMVGTDGRVRVMDFGLARGDSSSGESMSGESHVSGLSSGVSMDSHVTDGGDVVGTPAYMSPEQHRGEDLDRRSDVFSFCVALFEAVHGRRPFRGSLRHLVSDKRRGRFEFPESDRAPRWLRAVIARGLAPDPDDRWPSIEDLLDALRPPRRRALWGLTAGVLVVAGGAAIWGSGDRPRCTGAEAKAEPSGTRVGGQDSPEGSMKPGSRMRKRRGGERRPKSKSTSTHGEGRIAWRASKPVVQSYSIARFLVLALFLVKQMPRSPYWSRPMARSFATRARSCDRWGASSVAMHPGSNGDLSATTGARCCKRDWPRYER